MTGVGADGDVGAAFGRRAARGRCARSSAPTCSSRWPAGLLGICPLHANSPREAVVKRCTQPLLAGGNMGTAFVVATVQEVTA